MVSFLKRIAAILVAALGAASPAPAGEVKEMSMIFFPTHMDVSEEVIPNDPNSKDILTPVAQLPVSVDRYIMGSYQFGQGAYYQMNTTLIPEAALETPLWELVVDYSAVGDGGVTRAPEGSVSLDSNGVAIGSAPITWEVTESEFEIVNWGQIRLDATTLKENRALDTAIGIFFPHNEGYACRIHSVYLEIKGIAAVSISDGSTGTPRVMLTTDVQKRAIELNLVRRRKG